MERNALVTGGAQGIGRAICHRLAQDGVRIAIADIRLEAAQHVAEQIGRDASAVQTDVTDEASIGPAVHAVRERFGHIDILVNNAVSVRHTASSRRCPPPNGIGSSL